MLVMTNGYEKGISDLVKQMKKEGLDIELIERITNLTKDKIKKINSFDSCLWNLRNVTTYSLKNKSLGELQTLHSSLTNRLEELTNLKAKANQTYQDLEAAKWTGEKPTHLSNHDFDRLQNDYSR